MPVSASTLSFCSGDSDRTTPSSSSTSAAPDLDETERLPCFATGTPPAAATNAAVVEMLNEPTSSPPVPTMSMTAPFGSMCAPFSRITSAQAVISVMVSPFMRSAVRSVAISMSVAVPSIISSIVVRAMV